MSDVKEVIRRGPIINAGNTALSCRIREIVQAAEKLVKYDPSKDPVVVEHKKKIDDFFGIKGF